MKKQMQQLGNEESITFFIALVSTTHIMTLQMKKLFFPLLLLTTALPVFAQHRLEKLWESDSITLKGPESALFDPMNNFLYVSSMGSGSIVIMGHDGKIINKEWMSGLKSNMGSAMFNGLFYTTEPSGIAVIDLKKVAVIKHIAIDNLGMLNDVAVDRKGIVYTSDTRTGKVYRIEDNKATIYLENIPGANGLLCINDDLYVVSTNAVQKVNSKKEVTRVADGFDNGLDGIVMVAPNEFVISNYTGILYYVKADGSKEILLDSRGNLMANDISYDDNTHTLYVPAFNKNRIIAYQLK